MAENKKTRVSSIKTTSARYDKYLLRQHGDKYIIMLQIWTTKKEQDMDVATRVSVQLQLSDPTEVRDRW